MQQDPQIQNTVTQNQPVHPPKKDNSGRWFWGIFLSLLFFGMIIVAISFFAFASAIKRDGGEFVSGGSGDKIAIVEINDVIVSSEKTVEQIKRFREDKSIKAIILRVNTPGGGVAASQEIYEEVKKTRDGGKIIVVSMGSIAASGGYYIAVGSSLIIANPGTLTGSIGVIAQFISIKDLAEKLGISQTTIKSGSLKDAGSPFKTMNDSDKAYFQDVVDNSFGQFLDVVAKERKMDKETLLQYANGRVFTGLQAKEYGLLDSLGTFEDAIRITGKMAGIEGEPRIVREKKKFSFFEEVMGSKIEDVTDIKGKLFDEPILQYKFQP
ncbi:MAG TPA: signal peptide peptidase SppA [Ignavibacteria bacterium]|nr:signal peptide peptidase SppA [Ignavibacteria bacterium]HRF66411.1 signal peptide peptidase SppA [Ignavibacteria bacterium]HRJ05598.1 signal peptide peptidase SppA [Ignavibacteria bacterium]